MARERTTRSPVTARVPRASALPATPRLKCSDAGLAPCGFDLLVLTVANDVQRRYAEQMLDIRKTLGTLPHGLETLVI
ncbi:MAG: hypothetical protein EBR07_08695, partial [Planctomycetes bacterium]|nr:hypothetical protein [Planctomycetota bacterium]